MVSNFHWDSCTETALFRTSSEELVFLHPKLEHTDHQEIFMLDANLMQFLFWLNSFFQCFWFLLEIVTFFFWVLQSSHGFSILFLSFLFSILIALYEILRLRLHFGSLTYFLSQLGNYTKTITIVTYNIICYIQNSYVLNIWNAGVYTFYCRPWPIPWTTPP